MRGHSNVGIERKSPLVGGAPPDASEAEADLVARLKRGDEDAAGEFFDRYSGRIRRFIAQSLGSGSADVDDILQDTFVALAEAIPFFRGDSSLFTFACAIAHRKALSFIRTNARRARLTLVANADASGSESVHNAQSDRGFGDAMAAIRPEYRQVLILKYVEEIGVVEIARVLRISEHAVESRLARARSALRKAWKVDQ